MLLGIVLFVVWYFVSMGETCGINVIFLESVLIAHFVLFRIPIHLFTIYQLKQRRREPMYLPILKIAAQVIQFGWMVYCIALFFSPRNDCDQESVLLFLSYLGLIIFGFYMVLKLIVMISVIVILLICYFIYGRRRDTHSTSSGQPMMHRWGSRPERIIRKLGISSYDPSVFKNDNLCAICMEEYTQKCDITVLPCDQRHYFHTHCIKKWLERETSCPFCKAAINFENDSQGSFASRYSIDD